MFRRKRVHSGYLCSSWRRGFMKILISNCDKVGKQFFQKSLGDRNTIFGKAKTRKGLKTKK